MGISYRAALAALAAQAAHQPLGQDQQQRVGKIEQVHAHVAQGLRESPVDLRIDLHLAQAVGFDREALQLGGLADLRGRGNLALDQQVAQTRADLTCADRLLRREQAPETRAARLRRKPEHAERHLHMSDRLAFERCAALDLEAIVARRVRRQHLTVGVVRPWSQRLQGLRQHQGPSVRWERKVGHRAV
jgi:hypothetical protein